MSQASADLTPIQDYLNAIAPRGRTMLLPALHQAQSHYGWLPTNVQEAISRTLRVPLADIHGVIEFYTMFYNEPIAKKGGARLRRFGLPHARCEGHYARY